MADRLAELLETAPAGSSPPTRSDEPGFFDWGFRRFLTPALIRALYALEVVVGAAVLLWWTAVTVRDRQFEAVDLLLACVGYASIVLGTRIAGEAVLVLFRIEENTRALRTGEEDETAPAHRPPE